MMRPSLLLASLLLAATAFVAGAQETKPSLPPSGEKLPAQALQETRVLLIGGGSSHDFEKFFHQMDSATLRAAHCVTAYTGNVEEALAEMPNADVLVISTNQPAFGGSSFQEALVKFAAAGKGLVLLHPGLWFNWPPATGFNAHLAGGGARSHDALGPFTVTVKKAEHPIMAGVPASFGVEDELYHVNLDESAKTEVLATTSAAKKTGTEHASVWTVAGETGKIACIALGHDQRVHELGAFRTLLTNAVHWAAGK